MICRILNPYVIVLRQLPIVLVGFAYWVLVDLHIERLLGERGKSASRCVLVKGSLLLQLIWVVHLCRFQRNIRVFQK
jgi:hypothetical protein